MDKLDYESWESPGEPTPAQIANKAAKEWRSKGKRVRLQRKFVRVSVSVVALHRPFSCFLPGVCGARIIFLGPHRPLHERGPAFRSFARWQQLLGCCSHVSCELHSTQTAVTRAGKRSYLGPGDDVHKWPHARLVRRRYAEIPLSLTPSSANRLSSFRFGLARA